MRKELNFAAFRKVFSARIEVLSAIRAGLSPFPGSADRLSNATESLRIAVDSLEDGQAEVLHRAFAEAAAIFVSLAKWKDAVRSAEVDPQRFLNAAKLRASEVRKDLAAQAGGQLASFLDRVKVISGIDDLADLQADLLRWPLPVLLFASNAVDQRTRWISQWEAGAAGSGQTEPPKPIVAFVRFDIDGLAARDINYLQPCTAHDLSMELRVSHWPSSAGQLRLVPIFVDERQRNWLPNFTFAKPEGVGPHVLTATGRVILEIPHSFGARPYEFLYAAEFDGLGDRRSVQIVGHRRLRLEGSDIRSTPLTGFSNVDAHLLLIRDRLRSFPGLPHRQIANAMIVLVAFGSMAARALREGTFASRTLEKEFQRQVAATLRMRPEIGEELHEHTVAASGITDLIFREIPIELKVEIDRVIFPEDCIRYFDQTAAYALGLGKKVGILAVLETSSKMGPVGVVDGDIKVFEHRVGQPTVAIVVVVVRGGFPPPSSYS